MSEATSFCYASSMPTHSTADIPLETMSDEDIHAWLLTLAGAYVQVNPLACTLHEDVLIIHLPKGKKT